MLIGAAVLLGSCKSDAEKTSMSMNGDCVLMATATKADISLENYLTPVLQLAWQSPQWYSNDDTRKSTFNNLPAYIQTATEPGFGNIIESAANGQSMTYTAGNLNSFAKKLGMPIGKEGSLFFRIRCGNLETYSNVCEVKITPISVNMTRMAVLNQEKTDTISRLWSPSEDGIYTGMMKASAWMNCWFMEADGTVWGNTPVSDSEFVLSNDNPWNCWFPDASGDYFVTVNTVKGWWSASHIETMTVNGEPMKYNKEDGRWETTIEPNGETTLSFEATAKLFDTESRTDAEKAKPQTYNFTVKGDTLVIGEKGNATFTGTGIHTISVSIDDDGQYIYKVMAGDQTQQEEPSTPKPTELKVYDKEKQEVLSTLTKTGDGIYSGSLEAKWGWFNFLVYDAENSIWYGSDPADATMLSSEEGFYNLWIPADITGIFTITVDLNTMKWTFERTGDLPPVYPSELRIYGDPDWDNGEPMATLSQTEEGKYSGTLTTTKAWHSFQVVDATQTIWVWYGAGKDSNALKAGGSNLWTGEEVGDYTIEVNLSTMTWSATFKSE